MSETPYRPPTGTKRLLAAAALAFFAFVSFLMLRWPDRPTERPPFPATGSDSSRTISADSTAISPPTTNQPESVATTAPGKPATAPPAAPMPGAPAPHAGATATSAAPDIADEFGLPEVPGVMALATVETEGKRMELRPNQIGEFPRVAATPQQSIPVRIRYPDGEPDQEVAVAVQDGGQINERDTARVLRLDADRGISFRFVTGTNAGLYRVSLRKGVDRKTFTVWVGPELRLAEQPAARP